MYAWIVHAYSCSPYGGPTSLRSCGALNVLRYGKEFAHEAGADAPTCKKWSVNANIIRCLLVGVGVGTAPPAQWVIGCTVCEQWLCYVQQKRGTPLTPRTPSARAPRLLLLLLLLLLMMISMLQLLQLSG